jgi:hypothetical protein
MDAAAIAALNEAIPLTLEKNIEHGGAIYKMEDGNFSYNGPDPGEKYSFQPGYTPSEVAIYHTHINDPSKFPSFFSPQDKDRGGIQYLGTPSGKIKKFDPEIGKPVEIRGKKNFRNKGSCP